MRGDAPPPLMFEVKDIIPESDIPIGVRVSWHLNANETGG
jgi:hypothetical protein